MAATITVLIPCKDEEHNIIDCIASARQVADEILVADSGSTDATLSLIAACDDVRLIEREYVNSADFKNWAIPQASHPWVLVLDADERVTPELTEEINKLKQSGGMSGAYAVRRTTFVLGYRLNYSGAQSSTCTRLFPRTARYTKRRVHADIDMPKSQINQLDGKLEHHTCQCLNRYMQTQNRYTTWSAEDSYEKGRRAGILSLVTVPPLKFFKSYVLKLGFLDGAAGLLWCSMASYYSWAKYAKLWELGRSKTLAARHAETAGDNRTFDVRRGSQSTTPSDQAA